MPPYSSAALDPYGLLGVARDASPQEIKQAYRRIALETHPDRNGGDPQAADRFRQATRAYALLRDPVQRPRYDRTGQWEESNWSPDPLDVQLADAIDLFAREFGTTMDLPATDEWPSTHAGSVALPLDVTWAEVETGGTRRIPTPCGGCAGSGGREGSAQVRCTSCGGSGRLRNVEAAFLGPRIRTERCDSCRGSGRRPLLPCPACDGSGRARDGGAMDVVIPRGVADGTPLYGMASNGSHFVARLTEDARWARDGTDLYATGRIPYEVAVLGGTAEIELPGRSYRVKVEAGTASGHRSRIPSQGLPTADGSGRGDLVLTLHVAVPDVLGTLERWLLSVRRFRSAADPGRVRAAGLVRHQARAWKQAVSRWRKWRQHHHRSSLQRIESAADSLRSTARLVSESEARLGPLLEGAFPQIAPEAGLARRRLDSEPRHRSDSALGALLVDGTMATLLAAALWIGVRFAAPAIAAAGATYEWSILRALHPAFFALAPLVAGMVGGAVRASGAHRRTQAVVALPLGLGLAMVAVATAGACYAVARSTVPDAETITVAVLTGALALTIGAVPLLLFILGASMVEGAHALLREALDRKDRRVLRRYDLTAVDLAARLTAMERAFRELLARADDARHPLTSLLEEAADALYRDRDRRQWPGGLASALKLATAVALALVWSISAALAVVATLSVAAPLPAWQGLAAAAAMLVFCTLGRLLPPPLLERQRLRGATTALGTALGAVAAIGILGGGAAALGPGWLAAAAAMAAFVLSFHLRDLVPATATAIIITANGALAIALWPLALVLGGARRHRTDAG